MLNNPMEGFVDIHVQRAPEELPEKNGGGKPFYPEYIVSYRTGNFVFEEGLHQGRFMALSYNASGYMMAANDVPAPTFMPSDQLIAPQSFLLEADGQSLISHWEWGGFEKIQGEKEIEGIVTLRHGVRPVTVKIHTLLDGTPIMQRWLEVINTGKQPLALGAYAPISGPVQVTRDWREKLRPGSVLYRVGYMQSCAWGREGEFAWQDLPEEIYTVAGRYRRNRHRHPMFILKNQATGEYFICQFAWSSGYAFEFDLTLDHEKDARLSLKVAMDGPKPLRMLAPGEAYAGPKAHLGAVFGGLDEAVNAMHRHIRKTVMYPNALDLSSAWVQSGIGPEYDMSRESTLKAMDYAASIGAELFWIDAGWYAPPRQENLWFTLSGDWYFNAERYPGGMKEMVDYAHAKGMKFGLWMDAQRVGPDSSVAKEHPEWIGTKYTGEASSSGELNLALPQAAQWMEDQIVRVIEEYGLDFFRLDWNSHWQEVIHCDARDGYLESTFARVNENVYKVYDHLRKRFPNVIFENCAGGGGRTDLGLVDKFSHTWVTDWQKAPRSFIVTNGMTMALPPERINRLLGGQFGYETADMAFQIRNLMFTQCSFCGICPPFAQQNEKQMNLIRHHIALYKDFVRPMFASSMIYHHTPELQEGAGICGVLELAAENGDKALIGLFQLSDPREREVTVRPRGIDPGRDYRVTFDNSGASRVVDGCTLIQQGIRVALEGPLTSELILLEAVNDAASE